MASPMPVIGVPRRFEVEQRVDLAAFRWRRWSPSEPHNSVVTPIGVTLLCGQPLAAVNARNSSRAT